MNDRPNRHGRRRWAPCVVATFALLTLHAAPVWAAEGEPTLIQTDRWPDALVAAATFLLLVVVLGRFAWKPVLRAIKAREQALADIVAETDRRKKESDELLSEYKARLTAAEADIGAMIERSREQAETTRAEIVAHARKQAAAAIAEAERQIGEAKRDALNEIYRSTTELATDLASKIVRRDMTAADQDRLVDESIERLNDET